MHAMGALFMSMKPDTMDPAHSGIALSLDGSIILIKDIVAKVNEVVLGMGKDAWTSDFAAQAMGGGA